jgi:Tol biopolymer transport system component/tRNA A-37 threonylcarbamoyl transferase component Bud32
VSADPIPRLVAALSDRYRIERELGQGGMATVYLAEDLKHDRKVALKVLKPELAAVIGAERFVVEIKTTASLSHPHILPLFDSGTADGFLYYVMPFIDGETLRSKLDRETQLGIDEAVSITTAVADALDYAHRHNVIHRDIKPENILLHDGRPMVADFGIALALSAAAGGRMTETGMSLGTPHYMSPEQATAEKEITARSDVYSLGSVLYEMLTGNPPHVGASAQQIIMKIVTEEAAPVTKLRKAVPPNVAAAVAQAIEKLPADRFESAKAFAEALDNPGFRGTTTTYAAAGQGATGNRRAVLAGWGVAGLLLVALAATWFLRTPAAKAPTRRYAISFPTDASYYNFGSLEITIAPDGSRFIYPGGPSRREAGLVLQERDQLTGRILPGTGNSFTPSFSPDGSRLAVRELRAGALRVLTIDGAVSTTMLDSLSGFLTGGIAWGSDGYIYVAGSSGPRGILYRVPETGGAAEPVTAADSSPGTIAHVAPVALPGGRGIVYTDWHGPTRGNDNWIVARDPKTDRSVRLVQGLQAWYLDIGALLVLRPNGAAVMVPFDADKLAITGPELPILEGVAIGSFGLANLAVATDGTLMYRAGTAQPTQRPVRPVRVSRTGQEADIDPSWSYTPGFNGGLSLSPDGTRLAVTVHGDPVGDIWIKDLDRGPLSRLTFDNTVKYRPVWMRDGQSLSYITEDGQSSAILRRRADGGGAVDTVVTSLNTIAEAAWSADDSWLAYRITMPSRDIYAMRPGVDSAGFPVVASTRYDERAPTVSPDGKWLAYQSDESGRDEIYIRAFPDSAAGRRQVSVAGGGEPLWAHSGRELFYRSLPGQMVSIPITTSPTLTIGAERVLFADSTYLEAPSYRAYDVSRDDQSFVMLRVLPETAAAPTGQLVFVENWFSELRAKLGKK